MYIQDRTDSDWYCPAPCPQLPTTSYMHTRILSTHTQHTTGHTRHYTQLCKILLMLWLVAVLWTLNTALYRSSWRWEVWLAAAMIPCWVPTQTVQHCTVQSILVDLSLGICQNTPSISHHHSREIQPLLTQITWNLSTLTTVVLTSLEDNLIRDEMLGISLEMMTKIDWLDWGSVTR